MDGNDLNCWKCTERVGLQDVQRLLWILKNKTNRRTPFFTCTEHYYSWKALFANFMFIKGTVSAISSDIPCKDEMFNSQRYPWNIQQINNFVSYWSFLVNAKNIW